MGGGECSWQVVRLHGRLAAGSRSACTSSMLFMLVSNMLGSEMLGSMLLHVGVNVEVDIMLGSMLAALQRPSVFLTMAFAASEASRFLSRIVLRRASSAFLMASSPSPLSVRRGS